MRGGAKKRKMEPFEWQLIYKTNADYHSLVKDLVFGENRELVEKYISRLELVGKEESLLQFELKGYPGLLFQFSPNSTLNVFINWDNVVKLFEPLIIVRDKILKPLKGHEKVIFSYKDYIPIGRRATYKYLREAVKSIDELFTKRRSMLGMLGIDSQAADELREIKRLFDDNDGIIMSLKFNDALDIGYDLEKEGLIVYNP